MRYGRAAGPSDAMTNQRSVPVAGPSVGSGCLWIAQRGALQARSISSASAWSVDPGASRSSRSAAALIASVEASTSRSATIASMSTSPLALGSASPLASMPVRCRVSGGVAGRDRGAWTCLCVGTGVISGGEGGSEGGAGAVGWSARGSNWVDGERRPRRMREAMVSASASISSSVGSASCTAVPASVVRPLCSAPCAKWAASGCPMGCSRLGCGSLLPPAPVVGFRIQSASSAAPAQKYR